MLLSVVAGQEKVEYRPSLLPYRHCLHFVDRVTYTVELHRFFDESVAGQQKFVLWGPGGIG